MVDGSDPTPQASPSLPSYAEPDPYSSPYHGAFPPPPSYPAEPLYSPSGPDPYSASVTHSWDDLSARRWSAPIRSLTELTPNGNILCPGRQPDRAAFEKELRPNSPWSLNAAPPEVKIESILALIAAGDGVDASGRAAAEAYVRQITQFAVVHSLGWRLIAVVCLILGIAFLIGGVTWWALQFLGLMFFVPGVVAGIYIIVLWLMELRSRGEPQQVPATTMTPSK